jgi:hypothetical protein
VRPTGIGNVHGKAETTTQGDDPMKSNRLALRDAIRR